MKSSFQVIWIDGTVFIVLVNLSISNNVKSNEFSFKVNIRVYYLFIVYFVAIKKPAESVGNHINVVL